jgi:glycosyltransferase involved in cell wall biosynthesis
MGCSDGQIGSGHSLRHLYFDITDILIFFFNNSVPSGIQRAVVRIFEALQAEDALSIKYNFVFIERDGLSLKVAPSSSVFALIHLISTGADQPSLKRAVNECRSLSFACTANRGDVYVIIGAFWIPGAPFHERTLVRLKEQGVAIGVYVFDLIPVAHPELIDRQIRLIFFRRLAQIVCASDFVLAISEYTASEARKFLADRLGLARPVGVAPLAREAVAVAHADAQVSGAAAEVAKTPFVLCVGSIDHRKNQGYLIEAWRTLASENAQSTPNLVLAGRWGNRSADLKQRLIDVGHVGGKVIVFEAPTDADLAFLYRSCIFTVFPSLAEGWGLPVGESLALGKPCIASNAGPIPEVGGALARYFDPHELASGLKEFRQALDDEAGLAEWSARIAAEFVPRTWRQSAATLVSQILELAPPPDAPAPPFGPQLPPGIAFGMGAHSLGGAELEVASAIAPLARMDGWYPVEPMGSWSMDPTSTLRFRCEAAVVGEITVALALRGALPSTNNRVVVRSGDHVTEASNLDPAVRWIFAKAHVAADGVAELAISCEGDFPKPDGDPRSLYVGLRAMGYVGSGDLPRRMDLLQSILGLGLIDRA